MTSNRELLTYFSLNFDQRTYKAGSPLLSFKIVNKEM